MLAIVVILPTGSVRAALASGKAGHAPAVQPQVLASLYLAGLFHASTKVADVSGLIVEPQVLAVPWGLRIQHPEPTSVGGGVGM